MAPLATPLDLQTLRSPVEAALRSEARIKSPLTYMSVEGFKWTWEEKLLVYLYLVKRATNWH